MRFIDFKKIQEKNAFHIDKLRKLEFSKNLRDIFDLDKMCTCINVFNVGGPAYFRI